MPLYSSDYIDELFDEISSSCLSIQKDEVRVLERMDTRTTQRKISLPSNLQDITENDTVSEQVNCDGNEFDELITLNEIDNMTAILLASEQDKHDSVETKSIMWLDVKPIIRTESYDMKFIKQLNEVLENINGLSVMNEYLPCNGMPFEKNKNIHDPFQPKDGTKRRYSLVENYPHFDENTVTKKTIASSNLHTNLLKDILEEEEEQDTSLSVKLSRSPQIYPLDSLDATDEDLQHLDELLLLPDSVLAMDYDLVDQSLCQVLTNSTAHYNHQQLNWDASQSSSMNRTIWVYKG